MRTWRRARQYLADNQRYYALLSQGARQKTCVFPSVWTLPHYGKGMEQRQAERALTIKAEAQSWEGDADGALGSCGEAFRVAEHEQQSPRLSAQSMAHGSEEMAAAETRRVLSRKAPSPQACRALYQQLAAWEWSQYWARAVRGERATVLERFGVNDRGVFQKRTGVQMASSERTKLDLFDLYLTAGRPWANADKARVLDFYRRVVAAYDLPPGQRSPSVKETRELARRLEKSGAPLASTMTSTIFMDRLNARDRGAAEIGAMQVALAVVAFRGEHGHYPATLAEVEGAGWKLPADPFGQGEYRYQLRGSGFIVYSVGRNGKDDGGVEGLDCVFEVEAQRP